MLQLAASRPEGSSQYSQVVEMTLGKTNASSHTSEWQKEILFLRTGTGSPTEQRLDFLI